LFVGFLFGCLFVFPILGDDDFMGRFTAYPVFRNSANPMPAVLSWHSSKRIDEVSPQLPFAYRPFILTLSTPTSNLI